MRGTGVRSSGASLEAAERLALRYLARRDRSQAQVRAYLIQAGVPAVRARTVLKKFVERGYLDDEAYALRWARQRLARRPMGRARMEGELLGQGFDEKTTARTLSELYRDKSERALALMLVHQRLAVTKASDRARGVSLLRRYGFDEEMIEQVMGSGAGLSTGDMSADTGKPMSRRTLKRAEL
ncbi:MAG: regulatory protein RecX [Nitrospiraceae bacterium]